MRVIYRTCDKVDAYSGPPRQFNMTKTELVKLCFSSLVMSIVYDTSRTYKITIVDDHSTEELKSFMIGLLNLYHIEFDIIELEETGNGASLLKCYNLAKDHPDNEFIYFCEDDYLHDESALKVMSDFRSTLKEYGVNEQGFVIHPCDYIDRYQPGRLYNSFILLGKDRHWRQVKHTTGTFALPARVIKDYWNRYAKFAKIGIESGVTEDNSINLVYDIVPCFSPMPTLAIHLQYNNTLSPLIDWRGWANKAKAFYNLALK